MMSRYSILRGLFASVVIFGYGFVTIQPPTKIIIIEIISQLKTAIIIIIVKYIVGTNQVEVQKIVVLFDDTR